MTILDTIYLPENCLQGGDFPLYLTWNKNTQVSVVVRIPEGLNIKELFNVSQDKFEISNNECRINQPDVNGYVGMVIHSTNMGEPKAFIPIYISLTSGNNSETIEKKIILFRPDIKVIEVPEKIILFCNNGKNALDKTIKIVNNGEGTAQISIDAREGTEAIVEPPSNMEEFFKQFAASLSTTLENLKLKWPQYSEPINGILALKDKFKLIDEDLTIEVKNRLDLFDKVMDDDESFRDDFLKGLIKALFTGIPTITPFDTFLLYLSSTKSSRILIPGGLNVLKSSATPKKVLLTLHVEDLIGSYREEIELTPFTLVSSEDCEISLYQLFQIVQGRME